MKTPKWLTFVLLIGMLFAACTPASPTTEAPVAETLAPVETGIPVPPAAQAAQKALAEKLGLDLSAVTIREIEEVEWPNACLGAQKPDEMCAEMIVEGFRVVVEANGQKVEFHTNMDGSQIRQALGDSTGSPTGESTQEEPPVVGFPVDGDLPEAARNVIEMLANEQGLREDAVRVISVEPVQWPNSCLGVTPPGVMCMQVITPGYRIILEANDRQYEYHTDEAGGNIVEAQAPRPMSGDPKISWEQTENGICTRLEAGIDSVAYGPCGGTLKPQRLSEARAKELAELVDVYDSFEAGTIAGVVTFTGSGRRDPKAIEQRAVAEWAQSLRQELEQGEQAGLPVITWTREGGIAGFCDNMTVSAGGWVTTSNCKSTSNEPFTYRLNEEQLQVLYDWMDTYGDLSLKQSDPAGAKDGMTITLEFNGNGQQQAPRAEQDSMLAFLNDLYTGQ